MDRATIITTINAKTEAVTQFEAIPNWHVILVGDQKSQTISGADRLTFLSLEAQQLLDLKSSAASPLNHYARKNIGYLYAMSKDVQIIYDTDDDNLPTSDWQAPADFTCDQAVGGDAKFINIYRHFSDEHIWPRGFPLDELHNGKSGRPIACQRKIGVWQGLVDEDPDVDAIWRLVLNKRIIFRREAPICLDRGCYCPFNSQNTFWQRETFPLLYLPTTVRFRFTDILRSYIAQRLMWENGYHLGFLPPFVYQERNPHNYLEDFEDEIDCYLQVKPIVRLLDNLHLSGDFALDLYTVYSTLLRENYVTAGEMLTLQAWLADLDAVFAQDFSRSLPTFRESTNLRSGLAHGQNRVSHHLRKL